MQKAVESINLSWKESIYDKPDRPTLRNSHNVCTDTHHSDLYLFGGRSKGGCNNHLYILHGNKIDSGWKLIDGAIGEIPTPRKNSSMAYCANHLYVFGGNIHQKKSQILLNDLYAFNISNAQWTNLKTNGNAPSIRDRHSMTMINDKLYVFGGSGDGSNEFLNDLHMFDPKTSQWTAINTTNCPEARYEHSAIGMGNFLIISCGKCESGGLFDFWLLDTSQIKKDNAESIKWSKIEIETKSKESTQCRWGHSIVEYHEKIIFFGGWNGKSCFNDIFVFNFDANQGRFLSFECEINGQSPSIRTFHGTAILNNCMIVVGGRNMSKRLNDTFCLDLSDLNVSNHEKRMSIKATFDLQSQIELKMAQMAQSQLYIDMKKDAKQINLSSFELLSTLGTGSFGRVRLVCYESEYFAMKMLRKTRVVEMKQENHIKWEQKILSSIRHPFIVNLECKFQDKYFLYLVLELVSGGEFFTLLKRAGRLKLPHCAFYASQIVLVFQYLHHHKIVYRDLKPENLLISTDGSLKLTDFGFAKRLTKPFRTFTLCGTPEYIAPEILLNRGHAFSVDWWALGILVFEMFIGNAPFFDENPMKIYQQILRAKINWPKDVKTHEHIIPKRAREFIQALLTKNISLRLNEAVDVMKHSFFDGVNFKKVLSKSINKVPWKPEIKNKRDTKHFDNYDEDTDTEDKELDNDPFENDF